jgi:hypothetical protein
MILTNIDGVALIMKKSHCHRNLTWDISTHFTCITSGYVPIKTFLTMTFLHYKRYTIDMQLLINLLRQVLMTSFLPCTSLHKEL